MDEKFKTHEENHDRNSEFLSQDHQGVDVRNAKKKVVDYLKKDLLKV